MITPESIDFSVLPSLCLTRRAELPEAPAIYFAIDSLDQIQYIGRSRNLKQRWASHHRQFELQAIGGIRIAWLQCDDVSLLGEIEASGIEKALIRWFEPPLNRMMNPLVVHSGIQGTVETEDGKIFELNSLTGLAWLKSATSFRFVPSGDNKPYTVRQERKKGGDYWYGYRRVVGELHKRYIGKSSELSTVKLEKIAEALNTRQQSRATQVAEAVTDNHTAERVTALEIQVQALWESLEGLRCELLGKSERLGIPQPRQSKA